jgi:hypothetical protein
MKSPDIGNIHYRHLPGYRLEIKTADSGEAPKGDSPSESRLEYVDVTFLLIRARLSPLKTGVTMIVGSTGFGRLRGP